MSTKTPEVIYAPEEEYEAYKVPTVNVPTLEYEATTPTYGVDYNNEQFQKVEADKQDALTENSQVYGDMIAGAENLYQGLADQHLANADKLAQIQQENTDFTIEKIEQQKEQAHKDYLKEQSGAYVDWQKQSNRYGVEAERQASAGLTGSGYSESSQVAMYNTYQNRIATAREVLAQAKLNYDNGIKDAMLQNNAALAQIYADAYLKQAELAIEGALYKNQLILEQANKKLEIDQMYYNRWQDVLQQINTENALAEEVRQHNESMNLEVQKANASNALQAQLAQIEIQYKDYAAYLQREHDKKMLNAETQAEKDKLDKQLANDLAKLEKEREEKEKLLKYEYDLENQPIGNVTTTVKPNVTKKPVTVDTIKGANTTVEETTTGNVPLNMQSVVNAFGPISEAKLAQLIAEGKATTYVKNGQRYVQKVVQRPGIQGVNVPKTSAKASTPSTPLTQLRNYVM